MNPDCETSVRQIWMVGLRFHSLSTHTTNRFYRPSHGAPVSPDLVTGSTLSCTGLLRLGVTKPSVVCVDSEWNLNPTAHILPTDDSPLGYIHRKPARGTLYVAHLILAEKIRKNKRSRRSFVTKISFPDLFLPPTQLSPINSWTRSHLGIWTYNISNPCRFGGRGYSVSLLGQYVVPGTSYWKQDIVIFTCRFHSFN